MYFPYTFTTNGVKKISDILYIHEYPDFDGICLVASDAVDFVDILLLPDDLIVKLDGLCKFNSRQIASRLNENCIMEISFS